MQISQNYEITFFLFKIFTNLYFLVRLSDLLSKEDLKCLKSIQSFKSVQFSQINKIEYSSTIISYFVMDYNLNTVFKFDENWNPLSFKQFPSGVYSITSVNYKEMYLSNYAGILEVDNDFNI